MRSLPVGTLTFLFTDIEGSTRLLETMGASYSRVLERHHAIVRRALAERRGIEVGTQGDSFFAVFADPGDAVAAAVDIQRAVTAETWPDGAAVRLRIGLHTGDAQVVGDDYVGIDVNRAARIMDAANGRQIVISGETRDALRGDVDGADLIDTGPHRLRDLAGRARLFEVVARGVPRDSRPLRTLDAIPNNLPTLDSELVGRTGELRTVRRLLESPQTRLVTLTGPGGIGKTRLALQAAAEQTRRLDGVYFVDLSGERDPKVVMPAIAAALGLDVTGRPALVDTLVEHIGQREMLLLLDNFEQVMPAAADIATITSRCLRLRILVTSREALRVRTEQVVEVPPLSIPTAKRGRVAPADVLRSDAAQLFIARARQANPDFAVGDEDAEIVAEICARVDGLPLAIELAAARLRLFSLADLRDRLRTSLGLLGGGARDLPARQRTLRATIEWSYDLLDLAERQMFALMSVFSSADLAAVESVATNVESLRDVDVIEAVSSLVDKSLVRRVRDGRDERLAMLGTIREYAEERIDDDPELAAAGRRAHARYYAELAAARRPGATAKRRSEAVAELVADQANLEAAWRYFIDSGEAAFLPSLLDALWPVYDARGAYQAAVGLTTDLLALIRSRPGPIDVEEEITLRTSLARGILAIRGYTEEVVDLYGEALALADRAGAMPRKLSVLRSLASFHLYRADLAEAIAIGGQLLEIAEASDDLAVRVEGDVVIGPPLALTGDPVRGMAHLDRALTTFDAERDRGATFRLGPNPGVVAAAISALLQWLFGYPDDSHRRAQKALDIAATLGHDYSTAYATFHVALLDLWNGRPETTLDLAETVYRIAEEHDYSLWQAISLVLRGVATASLGDPETGLEMVSRGLTRYEGMPTPPIFWPQVLALKARACLLAGRLDQALATIDRGTSIAVAGSFDSTGLKVLRSDVLLRAGDRAGAAAAARSAVEDARATKTSMLELQAATRLASTEPSAVNTDALRHLYGKFTEGFEVPDLVAARTVLDDLSAASRAGVS
ncbi:MAG: ATP-binding protein [Chloroflexota bacterium]